MALGVTSDTTGLAAGWDWKESYVDRLSSGAGLERFSQGSLTPDTTLLYAGPPRFNGVNETGTNLSAIGLVDSFGYSTNASVQPLYEIGSNRTFFTRGKTQSQLQLSAMLADQSSLMKALSQMAYNEETGQDVSDGYTLNTSGGKAPGYGNMFLNLDSEALNIPFGILMVFKTKGDTDGTNGKIIGATYLELCTLTNFQFQVAAQAPVIQENVGIIFDRAVPVKVE
jgi:hypothetical protein